MTIYEENKKQINEYLCCFIIAALCNDIINISLRPIFHNEYLSKQNYNVSPNLFHYLIGYIFILLVLLIALNLGLGYFPFFFIIFSCTIISVINFYEYSYRGTVFTYQDISNFHTATTMLNGIQLKFSIELLIIFFEFFSAVCVTFYCKKITNSHEKNRRIKISGELFILFLTITFYCISTDIIGDRNYVWSWEELYKGDGFIVGTINNVITNIKSPIIKPAFLTEDLLDDKYLEVEHNDLVEDAPDIILILNETYYDLNRFVKIDTDVDFMKCYNELNGSKGHAIVPISGGGTNNSEYELLTSNSMSLINSYSPFMSLDLSSNNSIVKYLKKYGYYTMAAHSEQGANYKRNIVWKELGFDDIYFNEDFHNLSFQGSRLRATDASLFSDFIDFYEKMPENQPRFAYLLTIQNHSGYSSNPDECDIVHVNNFQNIISRENLNYDIESEINEYLSSVYLTDRFISGLKEYFEKAYEKNNRKVIVCMVGDHAPYFINDLFNTDMSDVEQIIRKREVPYFVWSNYEMNKDIDFSNQDIDLCCLMPYIFVNAEIPLNHYYKLLISLGEEAGCFTNVPEIDGSFCYVDKRYGIHSITEKSLVTNNLIEYYGIEYTQIVK